MQNYKNSGLPQATAACLLVCSPATRTKMKDYRSDNQPTSTGVMGETCRPPHRSYQIAIVLVLWLLFHRKVSRDSYITLWFSSVNSNQYPTHFASSLVSAPLTYVTPPRPDCYWPIGHSLPSASHPHCSTRVKIYPRSTPDGSTVLFSLYPVQSS